MAFEPTNEQKLAIKERGNVLVAAAAGSGKTAVLVERVIKMLDDETDPIDANRLLIVTFTNAAAAEMRARIEKRLAEECAKDPNNIRLLRQKHLIPSAKICTIDSFCIDLIRENFDKCAVSPDFKIGDEAAINVLAKQVVTELVNEYLEKDSALFREILDLTDSEFDESNFVDTAKEIFKYSCQMPFPDEFLSRLESDYKRRLDIDHPWIGYALEYAQKIALSDAKAVAKALDIAFEAELLEKYESILSYAAQVLADIEDESDKKNWNKVFEQLSLYKRGRLPTVKGENTAALTIKSIIQRVDKDIEELKKLFESDFDTVCAVNEQISKPILLLIEFVREYSKRLFEKQKKENLFTFYNTEQMALSLLCEFKDGEVVVKEDAKDIFDRFDEVLVDEYQDTNDLQDLLFKVISNQESHLFIVGDVKQSIYAFRGANPDNFLKKKNNAVICGEASKEDAKKIILSKNFRSRKGICDYINFFFRQLMTAETGKISYNSEEELVVGATFPENNDICTTLLINDSISHPDIKGTDHLILEARSIAEYIKKTMQDPPFLRGENGELRKAKYSDFVILMRSTKNKSSVLAQELRDSGIPVNYSKEEFLETTEVSTFMSLLEVIDNPDTDIALLTVMMSPIFGFSAEEMAAMRADKRKGSLISAVTFASQNSNSHAKAFLERLAVFRREAAILPLPNLLTYLLDDTDYLNIVSASNDGLRKKANLQLFVSYAATYCETADGHLGAFLRYLKSLPEGSLAAAKAGGAEQSVRIMSMHASKGLQFPICIVANTVTAMHGQGTRQNCVFNELWGLGLRFFDETLGKKCDNIGFRVINSIQKRQRLEEELRLLYVAMTRAEERLVLISSETDLEKHLFELAVDLSVSDNRIDEKAFSQAGSMNEWILLTALLHPDNVELRKKAKISLLPIASESNMNVSVIFSPALYERESREADEEEIKGEKIEIERLRESVNYEYPYAPLISVEAKSTVSRLANSAESERFAFSAKPVFMQKNGLNAARRGTAMHAVMQYIDFDSSPDISRKLDGLVEKQFITPAQAESCDKKALESFFKSELYKRILNAKVMHREMRFLTEIPASRVEPSLNELLGKECVMVQGAVDLVFEEDDGIVVLDFKTDRVDSSQELIDAYSEQLLIYSLACEKIFEKKVKEHIIYSFALDEAISF